MDDSPVSVSEPFPVFLVAHRYLLYDVNTVTYARREHHILGTLLGGLPQAPQQNVFLGIPLQLTPEEARLLVEKKVAYIVDDVAAHKQGFLNNGITKDEQRVFKASLDRMGMDATRRQAKLAADKKESAIQRLAAKNRGPAARTENWNDIPPDMYSSASAKTDRKAKKPARRPPVPLVPGSAAPSTTESLWDGETPNNDNKSDEQTAESSEPILPVVADQPSKITPTTSYPPMTAPPWANATHLPPVPSSYSLYKHLHAQGYFLAPGLRFGCQYMAYPGDPLRYHSHFLCNGLEWDQEFDLLDLIGGGRLGTGVKKGYLLGGRVAMDVDSGQRNGKNEPGPECQTDDVRVFCIEWGGM